MGKVAFNVLGNGTWQQIEVPLGVDDQQPPGEIRIPAIHWSADGLRAGVP